MPISAVKSLALGAAVAVLCVRAHADVDAPGEGSGLQLEEIVITAQKRTERLADVPVAATVLAPNVLAQVNAGDISDLNNLVPSVDLVGSFNGRVPLGIRGISSNAAEATVGIASGVAIMVDGVPVPSDSESANQLEDIKSVEVLKGPQATLGGRTASAGIINIVTRGPTDTLSGDVSATVTNDSEYRFNAFVSVPLTAQLLSSVSVYGNTRQFPIINELTDDHSTQHNDGIRGKLAFQPDDALDINLMADYHVSVSHGSNFVYSYVTPGASLLFGLSPPPLPPPVLATVTQSAVLAGVAPNERNKFYDSPVAASSDARDLNLTANINYRLSGLTFGSTSAYQHEVIANLQDLFVNSSFFSNNLRAAFDATIGPIPNSPGTWATFYNNQNQGIDVLQLSQEFKVASSTTEAFSYVAGVFVSDQKVNLGTSRDFTPAFTDYNVSTDTKTYDVYGRGTYRFTEAMSVIFGLRYNSDHLSYGYDQPNTAIGSAASDTSSALVGDIGLEYRFDGRSMAYLSFSRGYAPKVFNTGIYSGGNAVSPTGPLPATGQEHIDSYELGTKGRYLDQRLMVNADIFDTEYDNYQVQTAAAIPGVSAPIEELSTAGKARTRGLELETALAATDNLRINFSAAYIDAEFVTYTDAPCWGNGVIQTLAEGCHSDPTLPGQLVQDVSGKTMPNAPRFKQTLDVEQRTALPGTNFDVAVGANYDYRTRAQFQPDQNPAAIQSGFGILDLRVGLRDKSGNYSITAFCNNVTNHFYVVDKEDFWSSPWNSNAVVQQPARDAVRYFGVRLNATF